MCACDYTCGYACGEQDFGDSIPGHGGFTDRMDCQIIMGMFSYVYFSYFLGAGSALSAGTAIVPWMVDKLETMPREQQVWRTDEAVP